MKQAASFDKEINGVRYTFVRICPDGDSCEEYNVSTEEEIVRMRRTPESDAFYISDRTNIPSEFVKSEHQLSEAIDEFEAHENIEGDPAMNSR